MDWLTTRNEPLTVVNGPRVIDGDGTAGIAVTVETALTNPTFYAGTRRVAEQLASLPLQFLRKLPQGGKEKASDDGRYDVLRWEWNVEQTSVVAREFFWKEFLTTGNGYAEIVWNNARTQFVELYPIPSSQVRMRRIAFTETAIDAFGNEVLRQVSRLVYEVQTPSGIKEMDPRDMFHVPLMGDGLMGYSPVELGAAAIGLDKALQQHNAALMENACTPGGYWEHPGKISDVALDNLVKSWKSRKGARKAGQNILLEEGMKYNPATIEPEKAQLHESRQFSVLDLCRVQGGLQPHMVAELGRSTWNNIEQQSIDFTTTMMRPSLIKFEQEAMRKLLTREERNLYSIEHLIDELLRADTLTRYQAYEIGLRNQFLTVEEVREMENKNPLAKTEINGNQSQPDANSQ